MSLPRENPFSDPSPSGDSDVVVAVRGVAKKFCKHLKRSMAYGIMDLSKNLLGIKPSTTSLRKGEFWALKDIDFELRRGEIMGLIGVNGSGKTSLLRLIAGIFPPDEGEISVRGRVGALIAVGAGFHGNMTGRENIYLNGAILGMSRMEIAARFDEIVDFADIGDFLDAPVSTYSSGMRIRLGYAIATAIQPEVLLLDEILAVGDARFRNKCYNRMGHLRKSAGIIFVSHNMNQIAQICTRCLFIHKGRIAYLGDVAEAVRQYMETGSDRDDLNDSFRQITPPIRSAEFRWSRLEIEYGQCVDVEVIVEAEEDLPSCIIRVPIYDMQGVVVVEWNGKRLDRLFDLKGGMNTLKIRLGPLNLRHGQYKFGFTINEADGVSMPVWSFKEFDLWVRGPVEGSTAYQLSNHE